MIYIKSIKNLREHILKNGFNYANFAKEIGISRSCLNKYFKRGRVSANAAKHIADKLNVAFEDIFLIK